MSNVIGTGTIEVVADARKLKAGIEDAKKSLRTLGTGQKDISAGASQSIDRYVAKLSQQNQLVGKSVREQELFKLALRGASNEQLKTADSALRVTEAHERTQRITGQLRAGFIATAAAATTLATAYAVAALRSINFADHLKDLSKSTDIGVEDLAGLSLLAKQTGTDLDGLAKGINRMSVEMGKDPAGFRALGITATDSIGAFKQFADIFNQLPDINQRNALAMKVFGKSWADLAPALSEGGRAIGETIEKGARLSGVTQEMANRADEFNDRLEELKISSAAFGSELLPVLTKITSEISAATLATGSLARGLNAVSNLKLGGFGNTIAEQLKEIDKAMARTEAVRKLTRGAVVTEAVLGIRESALLDMKAAAQALQRQQALAIPGGDTPGERIRAGLGSGGDIAAAARASRFLKEPKKAGAAGDGAAQARAEAAAQLQFDLDQIRKASDATISGFANAERIMEAMRAAALVADEDYYESKRGFITLNAQTEEAALQAQIARLNEEEFTGKDADKKRIDRAGEVAAIEAKIAKVREAAAASGKIVSIQEVAANEKIEQSYADATIAAQAYIDTITKRNAQEIAGAGKGNRFREVQAGRSQIDEQFDAQRLALERQRRNKDITEEQFKEYLRTAQETYSKEIILYDERTEALLRKQGDWATGAAEAMQQYYDESRNIAKQVEDATTNAFRGMEDALVEFTTTGKLNFRSLATSIIADIARIQIKQNITGPLANWLSGAMSGGGGTAAAGTAAAGNTASFLDIPQAASGTPFVRQTGLAILHKGEAVIPASQNMGGPRNISVEIINHSSVPIQATQVQPRFDIKGIVVSIVCADIARGGPIRDVLDRRG